MTSNFTAFLRPFRAACLFVLLTVCCGGCSDSGSVDETPPADQLALSPSSLVFDEQDPAKNEFTVTATDGLTWVLQVKPSAAGCKFSASSGRGSGSFRVERMPDDSSIEIEAVHTYNNGTQLKSNSVRITRGKAVLEPTLELAPEKLTFDPDDASANTVQVRSNTVWSAVASDEGLVFSPASGENDGVITVTAVPAGKTSVITVTAGEGEQTVTRQVEITCENEIPVPEETIYYDDFDQTPFSGWADASAAWQNPTGPGAAGVTYTSARTRINNDNFGSSGRYPGASGANYVRIWFDNGPYFIVNDIALTPDQVDLTLSLGASFTAADCLIELSGDGSYWQRIDYTGSRAYNIWEQISVDFTLAVPVQRLFIRFTPQGSQSYGVNFDDLKLTTGPGGQTVDLDGGDYRFPELPSNWTAPTSSQAVVSGDYAFFTHWTQTVNTRKTVRNYSYCYDTRRHNPIWVAYPMHACYREGGFGRTDPDPWTADPSLDAAYQSKIYRKDGPSGSDPYQYWTSNTMAYLQRSGYWGKGHLCMSSERGGANQQINMQTFYPTNIAPQPSAKAGDIRFKDVDGNGSIDSGDKVYSGSGIPKVEANLSFSGSYKNFDLSFQFGSAWGHKLYNVNRLYYEGMDAGRNYFTSTMNAWTPQNAGTSMPRAVLGDPNENTRESDRFLENGNFVRLRQLQLGYSLSRALAKKMYLEKCRLYVSGENLFTITKYSGIDPEFSSSILDTGVDSFVYPFTRSFVVGLQVTF